MRHGTYIGIIAERMGIPGAAIEDLEAEAVRQMEAGGYTVRMDRMTSGAFRVRVHRVQRVGDRHTGAQSIYNEHTTSTSSYPVLRAWEKWRAHRAQKGRAA